MWGTGELKEGILEIYRLRILRICLPRGESVRLLIRLAPNHQLGGARFPSSLTTGQTSA